MKDRVKKYNERISKEKEYLKKENPDERNSFMSIKKYLIPNANSRHNLKEFSSQTSSRNASSQGLNPTLRCLGKEAPEDDFEERIDSTRLKTQKVTLLKRKFEPRYASPGKRKFHFEDKENCGSGKRTRK